MKNTYYILLLLFIITGCNNTTKETIVSKNLVKEFRPIIQGVWNNRKEMENISKGLIARDTSTNCISTMIIETKNIAGTALLVPVGLCNGQGTNMMLKFDPGKHTRTIILDDHEDHYELGYRISSGITTLVLYSTVNGKTHISEFVKTLNYFPTF